MYQLLQGLANEVTDLNEVFWNQLIISSELTGDCLKCT